MPPNKAPKAAVEDMTMNALTLREAFDEADVVKSAKIIPLFTKPETRETNEEIRARQYAVQKAMYDAALAKMTEEDRMIAIVSNGPQMQPSRDYDDNYARQASKQENNGSIFCSSFAHCIR